MDLFDKIACIAGKVFFALIVLALLTWLFCEMLNHEEEVAEQKKEWVKHVRECNVEGCAFCKQFE